MFRCLVYWMPGLNSSFRMLQPAFLSRTTQHDYITPASLTRFPLPVRSDTKVLLMTDKSGTVLALYTFLTSLNSISRLVYYGLWIRKMSEGTSLRPFLSNSLPARISKSDSAEAFTSNLKTHFQLVLRCPVKIKSDVWLQQHVTSIFLKSNSMLKKKGRKKDEQHTSWWCSIIAFRWITQGMASPFEPLPDDAGQQSFTH